MVYHLLLIVGVVWICQTRTQREVKPSMCAPDGAYGPALPCISSSQQACMHPPEGTCWRQILRRMPCHEGSSWVRLQCTCG